MNDLSSITSPEHTLMPVSFYYSHLCPRCQWTKRQLHKLLGDRFDANVLLVELFRHPLKILKDDIRMIPALKCDGDILSGFIITKADIRIFLETHGILLETGTERE